MTREDRVLALFAAANPVADPNTFAIDTETRTRLEAFEQRSATMEDTRIRSVDRPPVRHARRNWLVGLAAAVVVLVVVGAVGVATLGGGGGDVAGSPASVIEDFYRAFPQDVEGAVAVFAEDAVLTGAPVGASRRDGIAEIRSWIEVENQLLSSAELTRIEVSGDTVTWDEQVTFQGRTTPSTGHVAVIENGKIVTWDFGTLGSIELPGS